MKIILVHGFRNKITYLIIASGILANSCNYLSAITLLKGHNITAWSFQLINKVKKSVGIFYHKAGMFVAIGMFT